jgi:4-hydroxy-2-oxoglutarate aldolase
MAKLLPQGIYTPLPTFFLPESEDLDLDTLRQHVVFVAQAGTIPVLAGSAGEAPHLSAAERITLIKTARHALDEADLRETVLVAGVGAYSTRETIQFAKDAEEAGADFAMVIPPGYYAGQLAQNNMAAVRQFFVDVAHASPLPVILYNFPGVSGGLDIDSDLVVDVARACPNVVGVKLTCANVGKITRITALVHDQTFIEKYPRCNPAQAFQVIDGYIDILLPSMASGAAGAISGLPNVAPRLCVRLLTLASSGAAPNSPEYKEAQRLQNLVALADGVAARIGIAGLKMLTQRCRGYGSNAPRRPLLPMDDAEGDAVMENAHIKAVLEEEKKLSI